MIKREDAKIDKVFVMESSEKRLLIEGLTHCRTQFIEEDKPIEDVNDMFMKVIKAKSKRISDKVIYKIKMKEYDYRVMIALLNIYRLSQEAAGIDNDATCQLLLRVINAHSVA